MYAVFLTSDFQLLEANLSFLLVDICCWPVENLAFSTHYVWGHRYGKESASANENAGFAAHVYMFQWRFLNNS